MANLSVNLYTVNEPWLYSILWCAGVQSVTSDSSHVLRKVPFPIWLMVSAMRGKVLWSPGRRGAVVGCRGGRGPLRPYVWWVSPGRFGWVQRAVGLEGFLPLYA